MAILCWQYIGPWWSTDSALTANSIFSKAALHLLPTLHDSHLWQKGSSLAFSTYWESRTCQCAHHPSIWTALCKILVLGTSKCTLNVRTSLMSRPTCWMPLDALEVQASTEDIRRPFSQPVYHCQYGRGAWWKRPQCLFPPQQLYMLFFLVKGRSGKSNGRVLRGHLTSHL